MNEKTDEKVRKAGRKKKDKKLTEMNATLSNHVKPF